MFSSSALRTNPRTEFDILKASHRFLRDDAEGSNDKQLSWEQQIAKKYYDNLYREFAVCNLKHYKSGNFALRWRTEEEVLSGAGETTCGNIRCHHHDRADNDVQLKTLEVPFSYEEAGEYKSCLVKLVLCARCTKKLMWKWEKEREKLARDEDLKGAEGGGDRMTGQEPALRAPEQGKSAVEKKAMDERHRKAGERGERKSEAVGHSHRSRSRSPRARRSGAYDRRRSRS
ncbi:hypothetical protein NEOLEDRAFT_1055665 [Neolentinus lepideus HHB14362 ss-1]|uniref:Protein FRA10AC1 n=1 Tax=Neolentinus lepideus HHB14362 ss-1 TaxID=1314782 RepID=A0A165VKZ4_9AGAM|nr:hypothetical protein NEOLEDRAFT_1055665 [Neolentinus lepideus HHB14362 ss-1]